MYEMDFQIIRIKGGLMNRKVYVANLPYQATEPEIKDLFSKAGSVMSVKIVQDRRAVSMLNRQDFMGKSLLVKEATEKRGFRGR
jgi:RNA recognition motif-containing protein